MSKDATEGTKVEKKDWRKRLVNGLSGMRVTTYYTVSEWRPKKMAKEGQWSRQLLYLQRAKPTPNQ